MLLLIVGTLLGIFVSHELYVATYNLWFHPLSCYPGPKHYIAFPILRHFATCIGTFDSTIRSAHLKHGEVVRFCDNGLSFTNAQAWKDIYGYSHNEQPQWQKVRLLKGKNTHIINGDDADHSRFRRALSYAFSEKGLRGQEPVIKHYIDKLVSTLRQKASRAEQIDMTMLYNLTTFDIMSDLTFGQKSDCLANGKPNIKLVRIWTFLDITIWLRLIQYYSGLWAVLSLLTGWLIKRVRRKLIPISSNAFQARVDDTLSKGRGDFMESMLRYHSDPSNKQHITEAEMRSNANILFVAGSETIATLLTGATYFLCRNADALRRCTREVRSAFASEDEISFTSTSARLPYMLACLEETLRLYPPAPSILARVAPGNAVVNGYSIPEGTEVGVHQSAANWSEMNFHRARDFVPERWLRESINDRENEFHNDKRDVRQPFSYGPRNCIGKNLAFSEMRQILARVLWNFDIDLVAGQEDWAKQRSRILWIKPPLMVRLRERAVGGELLRV